MPITDYLGHSVAEFVRSLHSLPSVGRDWGPRQPSLISSLPHRVSRHAARLSALGCSRQRDNGNLLLRPLITSTPQYYTCSTYNFAFTLTIHLAYRLWFSIIGQLWSQENHKGHLVQKLEWKQTDVGTDTTDSITFLADAVDKLRI